MAFNNIGLGDRGKRGKLWMLGTAIGVFSVIAVTLVGACTGSSDGNGETTPPEQTSIFPFEVTDQAGKTVTIEAEPQKIISLAPSNTEIIYALGLEDRLVGVTEYCDYPEAAKDKPKIGGFSTVDIEKVVEIQPDLILATNIHLDEITPALEGHALTVLTLDPETLDEVLEAITLVGKSTGKEDEASQLVADMRSRIDAVVVRTAGLTQEQRPKVFFHLFPGLWTVGADALINELILKAGGLSIAQDLEEDYPKMSLETIVSANPQVMIASVGHGEGSDATLQFLLDEERLADVDARINGRVSGVTADFVNRLGPRIVDGLEQIARLIHPEIFGEVE